MQLECICESLTHLLTECPVNENLRIKYLKNENVIDLLTNMTKEGILFPHRCAEIKSIYSNSKRVNYTILL